MKIRRALISVALAATVVAAGCGSNAVAATVDGVDIDRSEFEKELKALRDNEELQAAGGEGLTGSGKETVSADLAAGWLTALIYDALISNEFERRDLKATKEDNEAARAQLSTQFGNPKVAAAFPDWFRDRLAGRNARALAVRKALSGFDQSQASLEKYYEENKDSFSQACLSHILVKTKEEADAAVAEIKAAGDVEAKFAEVAKARSTDQGSAASGGNLDCNPKGVFVGEFDAAAFSIPLKTVSDPVQTQFGFHILYVRERKVAPFEEAREQAKTALNAKTQEALSKFLADSAKKAKVTLDGRYGNWTSQPGGVPEVIPPQPPAVPDSRPGATTTTGVPQPAPGGVPEVEVPAGENQIELDDPEDSVTTTSGTTTSGG